MAKNNSKQTEPASPLLLAAAASLIAFHGVGALWFEAFQLDLGSLEWVTPQYLTLVTCWLIFGGGMALTLAIGLDRLARELPLVGHWLNQLTEQPSPRWIAGAILFALSIPSSIRLLVMANGPLTDDESVYRFGAQLFSSGRLWVPSPPMKLFFDQNFMINDGRLYPAYFMGWPALLAIGVRLGVPAFINPILSALTVPALASATRSIVGPRWIKIALLIFLTSPFLQIAAATQLAHTACLLALTCALACYFRTTKSKALIWHAALGFLLAIAFSVRPQAALAIGLPIGVIWVQDRRLPGPSRLGCIAAFTLPAAAVGIAFLAVLDRQNGSPLSEGYSRYSAYLVENGFRYSTFSQRDLTNVVGFNFADISGAALRTLAGLARLNVDLFGWPSSLAFIALTVGTQASALRLVWAMAALGFVTVFFQQNWGIDSFGPVHAFELSLPLLLLTVTGIRACAGKVLGAGARDVDAHGGNERTMAAALTVALITCACVGFTPYRLRGIYQIAAHVNLARLAPERAGLHDAIVFAPFPFVQCDGPPRHFVFFRPTNDPNLESDVLWVNDLGAADNQRLLELFPSRSGYLMRWNSTCQVQLTPVESSRLQRAR